MTELPPGFCKVSVLLTQREYDDLFRDVILTADLTYSAAIRKRLGLPGEAPYGIKAALRRMETPQEKE